jgi:hypothetical protein
MASWYLENPDGTFREAELPEVSRFQEDNPQGQIVAYEEGESLRVSTVFLFLDHGFGTDGPVLYESMVFPLDSYGELDCRRYRTRQEALEGHAELVAEHLHPLTPKGKRRR